MLHQHSKKELYLKIRAFTREMRRNPTPAEDFFWEKVRDRRLFGLKWNRQFIIQCPLDIDYKKFYIADFHCHKHKLIVELDGQIHLKQQEEDHIRTERIVRYGFIVERFSNDQILNHWDEVEEILRMFTIGRMSSRI